jgi:putative transposase
MWSPTTRRQYSRDGLRYDTDLTDAEWALIKPLLPEPHARGRPRRWPVREILNAIFYVLRGGIAWRLLPSDLPPKSTVFRWFSLWRDTGLFEALNHLLVMADRERVGREASPTAAVLDSQSVTTTESGGPRGYDAGKKVKGRKRQVMVDTDGRGLILEPQPADVQDRDGACVVLRLSRRAFPFIVKAFADSGYAGGTTPQAPAPREMAVFSLSMRTVAGTPPKRVKQAEWHPSQASMSLVGDQTIAGLRLNDSTMCRATRSVGMPARITPGKWAQPTCA